jgi:hypothetical protein
MEPTARKQWLITGTRYGRPDLREHLEATLGKYGRPYRILVGDARGVDAAARVWSEKNCIPCLVMKADWGLLRRRAGIVRNERMVAKARPGDLCLAFPHWTGSSGTTHCANAAARAGLTTLLFADTRSVF